MDTRRIKNYELNSNPTEIGNYGLVYFGRDIDKQIDCTIKEIPYIELAQHEANVMEEYGDQNFLPELYEFFIIKDTAYIVMEWCPGEMIGKCNFHDSYWLGKKKSRGQALEITLNILKGIRHLHNKGFLHYDICPRNILIRDNDPASIKIIDFGNAVKIANQTEIDSRYKNKDLYAAALICIFLTSGVVSPNPIEDLKSIDKDLQQILYKGIHPDKTQQYNSAQEFITALKSISQNY